MPEYEPAAQASGASVTAGQYDPAEHTVHSLDPLTLAYVPMSQALHDVARPLLKVPFSQIVGTADSEEHEYPGGQAVQLLLPVVAVKKPSGHAVQPPSLVVPEPEL